MTEATANKKMLAQRFIPMQTVTENVKIKEIVRNGIKCYVKIIQHVLGILVNFFTTLTNMKGKTLKCM